MRLSIVLSRLQSLNSILQVTACPHKLHPEISPLLPLPSSGSSPSHSLRCPAEQTVARDRRLASSRASLPHRRSLPTKIVGNRLPCPACLCGLSFFFSRLPACPSALPCPGVHLVITSKLFHALMQSRTRRARGRRLVVDIPVRPGAKQQHTHTRPLPAANTNTTSTTRVLCLGQFWQQHQGVRRLPLLVQTNDRPTTKRPTRSGTDARQSKNGQWKSLLLCHHQTRRHLVCILLHSDRLPAALRFLIVRPPRINRSPGASVELNRSTPCCVSAGSPRHSPGANRV